MTHAQLLTQCEKHAPKAELIPLEPPELLPSGITPRAFVVMCLITILLGAALFAVWGIL